MRYVRLEWTRSMHKNLTMFAVLVMHIMDVLTH